jgi:YD repeat-containing protein
MTTPAPNVPAGGQGSKETTSFAYDNLGNLLSQTDAVTETTTYVYNARNECVEQTDPDGNHTFYAYLCPCQLGGMDFFRAAVLFSPGREKRVGGPGGGASSPWSPAGGGRNRHGRFHRWGGVWQDAGRGQTGVPGGLSA